MLFIGRSERCPDAGSGRRLKVDDIFVLDIPGGKSYIDPRFRTVAGGVMANIVYQEMVISCEACNTVKKFSVKSEKECENLFQKYHCPNGCGRNMYSYFSVGRLIKKRD
jgi:hypothetical protein